MSWGGDILSGGDDKMSWVVDKMSWVGDDKMSWVGVDIAMSWVGEETSPLLGDALWAISRSVVPNAFAVGRTIEGVDSPLQVRYNGPNPGGG
jgi:hypothetical protein